mgnify:CR=1 FL=1
MKSFIKFADTLSASMGKAFSWCIVILMGGTCYEVIMAYAFNSPTLWNFDFSLQMYGAIFMMAGAYCLSTEAHVRGDVIYRLFPTRVQGWIDLVLYFIFFFPEDIEGSLRSDLDAPQDVNIKIDTKMNFK